MKSKMRGNRRTWTTGKKTGKNTRQYGMTRGARCRVTCGLNNTQVVRTWYDTNGGRLRSLVKTAGGVGYHNAKRATAHAANVLVATAVKEYADVRKQSPADANMGVHLRRRGMGKSRGSVLMALEKAGRTRLTVSDATKDAHNGCRRPKERRI
jgi:ribosomal protein S11